MRYCFDIDGVICDTEGTNYQNATPNRQVIDRINALHRAGHTIVLNTARGMGSLDGDIDRVHATWYRFTLHQMRMWGLHFHELVVGKPWADLYVDDKGMAFDDWLASEDVPARDPA